MPFGVGEGAAIDLEEERSDVGMIELLDDVEARRAIGAPTQRHRCVVLGRVAGRGQLGSDSLAVALVEDLDLAVPESGHDAIGLSHEGVDIHARQRALHSREVREVSIRDVVVEERGSPGEGLDSRACRLLQPPGERERPIQVAHEAVRDVDDVATRWSRPPAAATTGWVSGEPWLPSRASVR
jgi:hypothetical protein